MSCPSCNQALLAQQQAAATQGKCPFCGAKFTVPADVEMAPLSADGVEAEFLSAPGADPDKAVLYLHGGGYAIGSIKSHRYLMQNISRASGAFFVPLEGDG